MAFHPIEHVFCGNTTVRDIMVACSFQAIDEAVNTDTLKCLSDVFGLADGRSPTEGVAKVLRIGSLVQSSAQVLLVFCAVVEKLWELSVAMRAL